MVYGASLDGYNSNSSNLQLQFIGSEGGSGTKYYYLRNSAGDTLPYQVTFGFTGYPDKRITNGEISNIDTSALAPKSVNLPDISIPVYCWPSEMNLWASLPETQPAGKYRGTLTIVFTPNTGTM